MNVLEWRILPRRLRFMHMDPVVEEVHIMERVDRQAGSHVAIHHHQKLLNIQRDSATAAGTLGVVGATVSISFMYSANRGSE